MSRPIIALVLDESGSMAPHVSTTLAAYEKMLASYKAELPEATFVVTTFSSRGCTTRSFPKVADAPPTLLDYRPNGMTPLYDAVGDAIRWCEAAARPGDRVILAIQTDGQENDSKRETRASVATAMAAKKEAGWVFTFLGADIDAWGVVQQMGLSQVIPQQHTYGYAGSAAGEAFQMHTNSTIRYARTGDVGVIAEEYAKANKDASGRKA